MADDQVWKDIQEGKGISNDTPEPESSPGTSTEKRSDEISGVRRDQLGVKKEK